MRDMTSVQWLQYRLQQGVIAKPRKHRVSEQRSKDPWCNSCGHSEPYSNNNTSRVKRV